MFIDQKHDAIWSMSHGLYSIPKVIVPSISVLFMRYDFGLELKVLNERIMLKISLIFQEYVLL